MDIGSKLKKHRIQHQLTQEAVAEKLLVGRFPVGKLDERFQILRN